MGFEEWLNVYVDRQLFGVDTPFFQYPENGLEKAGREMVSFVRDHACSRASKRKKNLKAFFVFFFALCILPLGLLLAKIGEWVNSKARAREVLWILWEEQRAQLWEDEIADEQGRQARLGEIQRAFQAKRDELFPPLQTAPAHPS